MLQALTTLHTLPPLPLCRYSFSKFALSLGTGEGEGYDEACHTTVHTPGRQEDYLMIPLSLLAKNTAYQPTYYCGTNDNFIVYGKCCYHPPTAASLTCC